MERVFQNPSVEEYDVTKRLIGVVEHRMPRRSARGQSSISRSSTIGRGVLITYFLDPSSRVDN